MKKMGRVFCVLSALFLACFLPMRTAAEEAPPQENQTSVRVPIFMFHTSSEYEPGGLPDLYVRPSVFEAMIIHLVENGYTLVTFDDWDNLNYIERPVFITFDDGYKANYTEIFPILERHNARITIFLTLMNVREDGLTEEMIRRMSDSGLVKFESHSLNHRNLARISDDEPRLRREIGESRFRIEEITGKPVVAIAYPYGGFNQRVIEVAREYYRFGISTIFGTHVTYMHCDFEIRRFRMGRYTSLNRFIELLDVTTIITAPRRARPQVNPYVNNPYSAIHEHKIKIID